MRRGAPGGAPGVRRGAPGGSGCLGLAPRQGWAGFEPRVVVFLHLVVRCVVFARSLVCALFRGFGCHGAFRGGLSMLNHGSGKEKTVWACWGIASGSVVCGS